MALVSGIVWIVAGLAMAVLTLAVSPADQAPPRLPTIGLGAVAGLLSGILTTHLANALLTGAATGPFGSLFGAVVVLAIWGIFAGRQVREGA